MADIDTFFKTFDILECFQMFSSDLLVSFHCDCGNVRTTVSNFSELLAFLAAEIKIIYCCYIMED